jgi:hypothetical protein
VRDGIQNQRDLERGGSGKQNGVVSDEENSEPRDPNLVTWDGPSDSQNPKSWQRNRKWAAVICGES